MKSDNYRPDLSSLREVLADNRRYEIPDYQRRYCWDVSKIEELWEDVIQMYKDQDHRKKEYLLGSIVTVRGNNSANNNNNNNNNNINISNNNSAPELVVDGQQRLVSLTLMFCAIRNALKGHLATANGNTKSKIINLINSIDERVHEKQDVFIKLNGTADNALLNHICRFDKQDGQEDYKTLVKRAGKAIHKNYDALCVNATALCDNLNISNANPEGINELEEIVRSVTDRVCVIDITVEDENYAQQIFEALNSKGQQLTQSNLIKSHLIQQSVDAKKNWDDALAPFEKEIKNNPRKSDECIYYSLLSRNANGNDIGKRDLYKCVKICANSKDTADKFIAQLKEDIAITRELEKPQSNPPLDHLLHGLTQVNAIYFRRPIIAAVRVWGWNDRRTSDLIEFLLKFFFMYRSVCKKDVDKIRNIARNVTKDVINTKGNDELQIKDVCKKALEVVGKTDEESGKVDLNEFHGRFLDEFVDIEYDRRKVILYVFISIEQFLQKGQFVIPVKGFDVERIFPQKSNLVAWPNRKELKKYKNKIGNLTLLPYRWNRVLQNYRFEVKQTGRKDNNEEITLRGKDSKDENGKPIVCSYKNSSFKINDDIKSGDKWDSKRVIDRQEKLKKYAAKIWNLSEYV